MKNNFRFLKSIFLGRLSRTPYKLNFAITSICNSNCLTCNIARHFRKNPEIAKDELSTNEIANMFGHLPPTITWLSLSGGEPFLRKDIVAVVDLAIKKIPNLSVISIPSNGLSSAGIIEKVKQLLLLDNLPSLFINFSLDGPPAIHDKTRGIKGAYVKTWKTYREIKKMTKSYPNIRVNLEVTISRHNINGLVNFCRRLTKLGEKITVTIAHNGFLYKNESLTSINVLPEHVDKIRQITDIVNSNLSWFTPAELVEKIYLKKIIKYIRNPGKQVMPCTALKASCALDPFGTVTPCFMWGKQLGNIRGADKSLGQIFKQHLVFETSIQIKSGKCPNCWTPCEAYQGIIWSFLTGRWYRL